MSFGSVSPPGLPAVMVSYTVQSPVYCGNSLPLVAGTTAMLEIETWKAGMFATGMGTKSLYFDGLALCSSWI
jgi:hypothetical protein